MCELWLQMVVATPADSKILENARREYLRKVFVAGAEHRLRINPNDADAHTELGVLMFIQGNDNGALLHWRRAAEIDPKLAEPHFQMGMLYRKRHALAQARQELETAVRLNPNHAEAYGHLGFVMAELGDGAASEKAFVRALDLNPNDKIIRETLAELRSKMGGKRK
jgi:Flp pilus assembly protein TadD